MSKTRVAIVDVNGKNTHVWRKDNVRTESNRVPNVPPVKPSTAVISKTGQVGDYFMYTHAVIDNESELQSVLDNHPEVDLVSVKRFGSVEFMHVTDAANIDSILESGLKVNHTINPDLGQGTYVIQASEREVLHGYLNEMYDDDDEEIGIIAGYYTGEYLECIHGDGHVGYIVFEDGVDSSMIDNADVTSVSNYLYSW